MVCWALQVMPCSAWPRSLQLAAPLGLATTTTVLGHSAAMTPQLSIHILLASSCDHNALSHLATFKHAFVICAGSFRDLKAQKLPSHTILSSRHALVKICLESKCCHSRGWLGVLSLGCSQHPKARVGGANVSHYIIKRDARTCPAR